MSVDVTAVNQPE